MKSLVWNMILGLIWALATSRFTLGNLLIGFLLATAILYYLRPSSGQVSYSFRVGRMLQHAPFFLWELVLSNLRMAMDVIRPQSDLRPGVLAVPIDAKSDEEITMLANLISLTPGSLSLDVSDDRRVLYIHAMDVSDPEALTKLVKDGFERRVLEVLQ